jgi:hypothetical protein
MAWVPALRERSSMDTSILRPSVSTGGLLWVFFFFLLFTAAFYARARARASAGHTHDRTIRIYILYALMVPCHIRDVTLCIHSARVVVVGTCVVTKHIRVARWW